MCHFMSSFAVLKSWCSNTSCFCEESKLRRLTTLRQECEDSGPKVVRMLRQKSCRQ